MEAWVNGSTGCVKASWPLDGCVEKRVWGWNLLGNVLKCVIRIVKSGGGVVLTKLEWVHPFRTYAKFSEKLTFLTPWYAHVTPILYLDGSILVKWPCSKHCVKSVQIQSFFWSVFSSFWTEYGDLWRKSPYSVRKRENTDQKKLHIWTIFKKRSNLVNGYETGLVL